MKSIRFIKDKSEMSLGSISPEFTDKALFVTISPNPMVKHEILKPVRGRMTTVKLPYKMLPQKVQYDYCMRIVERVYNYSTSTKIWGTAELNKQGNVHLHLLLTDPNIEDDLELEIFRRTVMNHWMIMLNLPKGKDPKDYMNNIVFLTEPLEKVYEYIMKDTHKTLRYFPGYSNL